MKIKSLPKKFEEKIFQTLLFKAVTNVEADLYFRLGEFYFNGLGVEKNFSEAKFFFGKVLEFENVTTKFIFLSSTL